MTHYMELLASNQPWNLIIYMAIPVILAETLAITELYLLFTRKFTGKVANINRWAGILAGIIFTGIIINLLYTAVWPLTISGTWRGIADIVAVNSYLLSGVSILIIALLEFGLIGKTWISEKKVKIHVILVASFLVLAHIAMILGMVDPGVLGWKSQTIKNVPAIEHNMMNMDM